MGAKSAGRPAPLPADRPLKVGERCRLAAEILAAYLGTRREMARMPIAALIDGLRAEVERPAPAAAERLSEARRLGRAVARTLALAPGDTRCLVRSLVLVRLLSRRGLAAQLVIGARPRPEFLAHAWVEYRGEPVLSPGDGSFGRLVEL